MSFRENLIKARSHIIFLGALAVGLVMVIGLENIIEKNTDTQAMKLKPDLDPAVESTDASPMAAFDDITPLSLAIVGETSQADLAYAQIAWRYFENNTHPETGLVNSADKYPSTTMWETGSYFVAVISANLLGLIDEQEAKSRLSLALDTLTKMRLFDDILPNKAYNVQTAELVNYANKPVERGLGWSALDIARLVGTLAQITQHYPELAPQVNALLDHWDLSQMVEDGQLIGGNLSDDTLRRDQEGRVGYGQYAAKAMMLFGFDMYRAYDAEEHLMIKDVSGQPIPVDDRLHRNVTPAFVVSEPYVFDGLEFGFDARSHRFATAIYKAQEARYTETGILTAVSESHLDEAPYFVYSSVWGGGAPWAVMTFQGDRLDSKRTVTTKTAFAWYALFGTEYAKELVTTLAPLGDPDRGWPEGLYEADGSTNGSVTTNTNAVVLAALAFRAFGPLIRSAQ
ncbi:DUF3131 domain-containing protein [Pacificibacter marinus]|uniref:DUF3131 domain-containing protein n=1 Tax=Pacificibacter marinus TaxID=658057 RepID=UPI001C07B2C4|nr:DUF3131 domain-containing protein [Pacificibacter marinus]MBU2867241.1 DUF3131 domain-containing protein [Pacificibacter marinus]